MYHEGLAILTTNRPTYTYPVLKTLLAVILLIREEGTNPRASPTEDRNDEGNLNFVAWMDEMIVVDGPKCDGEGSCGVRDIDGGLLICLSCVGFAFLDKSHPSANVVSEGNAKGLNRRWHSLFIAFQSAVLVFESLWYVGRTVSLAILCSVRSLLVAIGDRFLP